LIAPHSWGFLFVERLVDLDMIDRITLLLFLSIGLSQQEYNSNELVQMDNGLWTKKLSDEPISGKVYGYFGEIKPLKKIHKGNLLNGKKEGNWKSFYHSTGKKKDEENYKDGNLDGLRTEWYENGNLKSITSHKKTRNRIEKIKYVEYYENGWKESEGNEWNENMKDWNEWTEWYENGQKSSERIWDEKEDGLWTYFYENGQKYLVKTYKDGKEISSNCWDKDGNECECSQYWWGGCK